MVLSSLGVNYKAPQASWAADIAYFNSISLRNIRPNLTAVPIPWSAGDSSVPGSNAFWRLCAQTFKAAGFFVTWGAGASDISASKWPSVHDALIDEATYLIDQGIAIDDFELGNEYEISSGCIKTAASVTQTGGVATVVMQRIHNFQTGEVVTIEGATPSGYNGTFTVTVVDTVTFTYSVSSGLTSPATGGIACYSVSIVQMNAFLRQLATDIKALPGWSDLGTKISYGGTIKSAGGVQSYQDWIDNGLGDLDTLSLHPYPGINTNGNYLNKIGNTGNLQNLITLIQAYPGKVYISEFNLDSNSATLANYPYEKAVTSMKALYSYLQSTGAPILIAYTYVGFLGLDNQFAMKNMDGSFHPMWDVLLGNHRRTFVP